MAFVDRFPLYFDAQWVQTRPLIGTAEENGWIDILTGMSAVALSRKMQRQPVMKVEQHD